MGPFILTAWLAGAATAGVPSHAVVLLYHHVADDTPASTSTSPELFHRQMDWLAGNGYQVLPLPAVVDSLQRGRPLPDRTVALTFDDGYVSVYTEAFPHLRVRGWPFTVFVCPESIDRGRGPVMDWDQLREMAAAGATVANHGLRHDHLQQRRPDEGDAAWRARVRTELLEAQARIEDEIGDVSGVFAYPYGEFDPDLRALVIEMGWAGFGQQSGPAGDHSDLAVLPRFPMTGTFGTMDVFPEKVRSLPLPVLELLPLDNRIATGDTAARRPVLDLRLTGTADDWPTITVYVSGQGRTPVTWSDPDVARLRIQPAAMLPRGRSRANVTAPSAWPGRWYWYSHTWIVGEKHGD